jgi:hypothetical protein
MLRKDNASVFVLIQARSKEWGQPYGVRVGIVAADPGALVPVDRKRWVAVGWVEGIRVPAAPIGSAGQKWKGL